VFRSLICRNIAFCLYNEIFFFYNILVLHRILFGLCAIVSFINSFFMIKSLILQRAFRWKYKIFLHVEQNGHFIL